VSNPSHPSALYLQDKHSLREAIDYVRYAESRGFEAVWQAESRLVRDAIVPMAAYAATTDRIKVGSGVINNWTRNAALIAATFSTLDDLAPGRAMCGLGVWWEPLASKVGVNRRKPLQAMRETVDVVRRLLAMEKVTFKGEFVQVDDIEIDIVHGDRSAKNVPIYIGATGMKMMELAGEIADGVLLNYLVSPAYNREAMEHHAETDRLLRESFDMRAERYDGDRLSEVEPAPKPGPAQTPKNSPMVRVPDPPAPIMLPQFLLQRLRKVGQKVTAASVCHDDLDEFGR